MPITARVQHTYNHKSGLAEHGIVNTFYFSSAAAAWAEDMALELAMHVIDFYDVAHPDSGGALNAFIAEGTMAPLRHTVKVYDIADNEPRAAKITHTTAGGAANNANNAMPSEVALCLSYRGALVSGTQPARRRGRVFLGPLTVATSVTDVAGWNRPLGAVRTLVCAAAKGMADQAALDGWTWVVHSNGGPEGNGGWFPFDTPITDVWVDDAWDTQRRRGANASTRTALTI